MESTPIEFSPPGDVRTTSLIGYQSRGHCLIIGPVDLAIEVAAKLDTPAQTILVPTPGKVEFNKQATEDGVTVVEADALLLKGYLGAFDCAIGDPESPGSLAMIAGVSLLGGFDLVLDLGDLPMLRQEVLPFGYKATGTDEAAIDSALGELAELQGEFEKPKYFEYDASVCAHSRSGITACTNCLDVCGTGAITSNGDGINIEPYLCQGCGSCATNCPSGAVRYAYPSPVDALSQLTELLKVRQQKKLVTVVYLHDIESGAERLESIKASLDDCVLPLAVEEVASVGMDIWFSALAYGVSAIAIDAPTLESGAGRALKSQSETANAILAGVGLEKRIVLIDGVDPESINEFATCEYQTIPVATYKSFNDKRQSIRNAVDHLALHCNSGVEAIELREQSPFGQVAVDQNACTLCLACVTVCPASALQDGATLPQLNFIESQCLQCGMCEQACPENAISLSARYLVDSEEARKPRVLNEEEPFNCIVCNTPFATQQIIGRMMTKLAGHWMFEDDKAKRRLKMCEDCRVKDMFNDSESGIDVHR